MGRMEALIVAALGRSPYDEQLVTPVNVQEGGGVIQTGYRYDDRGHPVNPETRQRMRDHVRASNQVMQAAGIIEENADVRARDKAFEETVQQETEMGLRRLEVGRVLLVAGVWGVCGFRRRILLYKSYSGGLFDIFRREQALYSTLHMTGVGLPALAVCQCIEWLGLLGRAAISGPNEAPRWTDQRKSDYKRRISRIMLDNGFSYVMLNYHLFAIIQQLNMWPSDRLLPSLRSLIPFSTYSPLQIPPFPGPLTSATLLSWATGLFLNLAPLGLVLAHSMATSKVSSIIYGPVYRSLPRPVNHPDVLFSGVMESSDYPEPITEIDYDTPDSEPPHPLGIPDWESTTRHNSAAPSQHAATLQALEGNSPNHDDSNSSDDEADHEISQQTLITFDVEATEMPSATMGTWSAELRNASEPAQKGIIDYPITALTILPPLLAAEGLSALLAGMALLPLEALMVRTVAGAFRRSAGLGTGDLCTGALVSWQNMTNIFAVYAVELAVTGAVWAAFTIGSQARAGKYLIWGSVEVDGEE